MVCANVLYNILVVVLMIHEAHSLYIHKPTSTKLGELVRLLLSGMSYAIRVNSRH